MLDGAIEPRRLGLADGPGVAAADPSNTPSPLPCRRVAKLVIPFAKPDLGGRRSILAVAKDHVRMAGQGGPANEVANGRQGRPVAARVSACVTPTTTR